MLKQISDIVLEAGCIVKEGFYSAKNINHKGEVDLVTDFDIRTENFLKEKLQKVQEELGKNVKIVVADLSNESKLKELYVLCKNDKIDVLINNAGFGDCGKFTETDLSKELEMIDVNIKAVHVLTKLFLKDMKKRNSGYILNVASMAAFAPGPLMATYYSTKAYVLRLTTSIYEELRMDKSKVVVSCLCPGPVKTNFNNVANVKFSVKPLYLFTIISILYLSVIFVSV